MKAHPVVETTALYSDDDVKLVFTGVGPGLRITFDYVAPDYSLSISALGHKPGLETSDERLLVYLGHAITMDTNHGSKRSYSKEEVIDIQSHLAEALRVWPSVRLNGKPVLSVTFE